MDNQKERTRQDEGNTDDRQTDVTRSENQQRSSNANEPQNVDNSEGRMGDGGGRGTGDNDTGSHQEGMYDKQGSKPMVDKEDAD